MRPTIKILLTLTLLIVGFLCLRLLTYHPLSQEDLIDAGFIYDLDDLSTTTISKFETKGTISGIQIYVDGQIQGTGKLKIGYNDSTSYREYELSSGTVDIEHSSDWYSELCYVTFIPTQTISGKIRINCDFIGD